MKLNFIFFDVVNTLICVRGSVGQVYADVMARHGITVDPKTVESRFREEFPRQPPLAFLASTPLKLTNAERAWWQRLVSAVIREVPAVGKSAAFDDLYETFAGASAWTIYEDVVAVLGELEDRGLPLGIISNFDSRLPAILTALALNRFFPTAHVLYSSAAGAAKPNPAIFQKALAIAGRPPKSVVYIGDDRDLDLLPARRLGMQALRIDRRKNEKGSEDTLHSLHEIIERLR